MKVLDNTSAVLSLGKLCDENGYSYEWINGPKAHLIKNGIRIQWNTENFVPIVVPGLSTSSSSSSHSSTSMTSSRQVRNHPTSPSNSSTSSTTSVISDSETREREDLSDIDSHPVSVSSSHVEEMIERWGPLLPEPIKNEKPIKDETSIERWVPCHSDMLEWLQEFRENLLDDRLPEHRDSHASSSHELSSELTRSVDLVKHSVYTHFIKDRNWEICKRTKITRVPCRRRIRGAVLRADNFGDLITADHKVLSEGCESWNNHRYTVVMQDLATQWTRRIRAKQKLHRKLKEACKSSWSPIGSLKSFTRTISWNLAKPVKIFPGIIVRQHHTDQKQIGLVKEQCAEWKEGTSAVLLQSGLNENWRTDSLECYSYVSNVTYLFSDGKTSYERRFGQPFNGPIIPFCSLVEYHPVTAKGQSRIHQIGKKVLSGLFLG